MTTAPPVPALDDPATDPYHVAEAAADALRAATGARRHDVALVLGSGWGQTVNYLGQTVAEVPAARLPGFRPFGVRGHAGGIRSVAIAGSDRRALVLGSRTHLYEGFGVRPVVHAVRVAARLGCRAVVLTNGCGGLNPDWSAGTPVLISDHINLTGVSPLEGPTFVDLTDLYSARLRAIARDIDPTLAEGVYVQFRGPQYETPAEVRMAGRMGGDLVGMSTALEAIAARAAGLEVLGISLVTNAAAGIGFEPLSHEEVVTAGAGAADRVGRLLARIVTQL